MNPTSLAVIPAAGQGSRLGASLPKLLVEVNKKPVITYIIEAINPVIDDIVIVVSDSVRDKFGDFLLSLSSNIRLRVQEKPSGMGDAIFKTNIDWDEYKKLLVVWGDQVLVSTKTVEKALGRLDSEQEFCVPCVSSINPYVQYIFKGYEIEDIRQTREGDEISGPGWSDVGVFAFQTKNLCRSWLEYEKVSKLGRITNERNFLPFLVYLSKLKWRHKFLPVKDVTESYGINTPLDLSRVNSILNERS